MILVQRIILEWHKDSRGGLGAVCRSRFPQAFRLPDDFFGYISFGEPSHFVRITQKADDFRIQMNRREIKSFDQSKSLRFGPMELIPKENGGCELRYRYDWHSGALPERYKYTREGNRVSLNEPAFELNPGDYGRAICNGRFVDWDDGTWWYEMSIINVIISQEKNISLDCFLVNEPTHYYRQIAQLY